MFVNASRAGNASDPPAVLFAPPSQELSKISFVLLHELHSKSASEPSEPVEMWHLRKEVGRHGLATQLVRKDVAGVIVVAAVVAAEPVHIVAVCLVRARALVDVVRCDRAGGRGDDRRVVVVLALAAAARAQRVGARERVVHHRG